MHTYRFIVTSINADPFSDGYQRDALALGFNDLQRIKFQKLYFIEGQLSQDEMQQLALKLLTDPVTQSVEYSQLPSLPLQLHPETAVVEVALRPGVTDPVAEQLIRVARYLGFEGVERAATGNRFLVDGLSEKRVRLLAKQLLSNAVIQHWNLGEITPSFPQEAASSGAVEIMNIRSLSDTELLQLSISRRAALDLNEMKAIQTYYLGEEREPTDVEFEAIAQTWSEHCVHKTFKAKINIKRPESGSQVTEPEEINSLIKTYLKAATEKIHAPWVISAFVDNAGILDFDDEFEVSFKVETHNHPSAIEPFGGANTGVGGVIRDVLGVSAKPIANTDVLCFGPLDTKPDDLLESILHPRRIQSGVVAGVQDYGNKIGIPTVNGAVLYDEGYTANPLVFCGCIGLAPKGKHHKNPQPGDRVIVLGGRTGRDGLRGATFSSMTMDAQTGEVSGASVQIGDPITEKGLIEVIVRARDLNLYNDITDCGAGGLSSAVGELVSAKGGEIELNQVRLKYTGLAPWEIWLSEAQERMVLAVPPSNLPSLQELCDTFDTELTNIGEINDSGRLIVRYDDNQVLNLSNKFLHEGIPQRELEAVIHETTLPTRKRTIPCAEVHPKDMLIQLLGHPNIASKASIIHLYDHEVQGGTVIKPLTGLNNDGPSDAAVIKPARTHSNRGLVISNGINPEYGKQDAYRMAWSVIDEAIRNAVAAGADPERIAILDNFCWGDPRRPETLGTLVEAVRGCHDAAIHYKSPFISGKDSLNNEFTGMDGRRHAIPPTLLISALGQIEDVSLAVSMDLKNAGNIIYLVGDFQPVFGGSHYAIISGCLQKERIPAPSEIAIKVYGGLHAAIRSGSVRTAHDLSEGGLSVAAAEMCVAGRLGMDLSLPNEGLHFNRVLFGETNGCLLVEVTQENKVNFENHFAGLPILQLGSVTDEHKLNINSVSVDVDDLVKAWTQGSL